MQKFNCLKLFILLLGLTLPTAWCTTNGTNLTDGYSHIQIKESGVQSAPKGPTIQATIDGHTLTVVFTENLGQVAVEITTAAGATVNCVSVHTPNGLQIYIPNTGD